jgi:hypothetical protein
MVSFGETAECVGQPYENLLLVHLGLQGYH